MSKTQNQAVDYTKNLKAEEVKAKQAEWEARVWAHHIQAERLRREAQYYDDDDYEGIPD